MQSFKKITEANTRVCPSDVTTAIILGTLGSREHDLQIYSVAQWSILTKKLRQKNTALSSFWRVDLKLAIMLEYVCILLVGIREFYQLGGARSVVSTKQIS